MQTLQDPAKVHIASAWRLTLLGGGRPVLSDSRTTPGLAIMVRQAGDGSHFRGRTGLRSLAAVFLRLSADRQAVAGAGQQEGHVGLQRHAGQFLGLLLDNLEP